MDPRIQSQRLRELALVAVVSAGAWWWLPSREKRSAAGAGFRAPAAPPPSKQTTGEGFIAAVGWQVEFRQAVGPGDWLRVRMTITDKRPSTKPGRGRIISRREILDSDDDVKVVIGRTALYRNRPELERGI